jgi:hypothetical protein
MIQKRKPSAQELKLLEKLVSATSKKFPGNWKENLLVEVMNDGGMGSLLLFPAGEINSTRLFGSQVSELKFNDADGIEVIVSLNVDQDGKMFELDSWKTDFNALNRIPEDI